MANDRRVNDFGQTLVVGVTGIDPTSATAQLIRIRKPSGAIIEVPPTVVAADSVTYTWAPGDLDEPGVYHGEVRLTSPDGPALQYTTTPFLVSVGNTV